jgi:TrpR-related protein YerC/YecD
MKKNAATHPSQADDLYAALLMLETPQEMEAFMADLCTPTEIAAFADRWHAARLLHQGLSQREVASRTGIALATVTRVARFLARGAGGYLTIIRRGSMHAS